MVLLAYFPSIVFQGCCLVSIRCQFNPCCRYFCAEIVRAMTQVISKGMAMYWGTSKWTPVEIMEAYSNCRQFNCITPIAEQAEYHFFCRDKPELYMQELYNKIGKG